MDVSKKSQVYLVRHGETQWNKMGIQQGQLDSPLTPKGMTQARQLGELLEDRGIQRIYCSDLGRAVQTAREINRSLNLPVEYVKGLRERHLGTMQGMTKREYQDNHPEEWQAFQTGDPDYCFPQGESARQRVRRTVNAMEEICASNPGGVLLVVTHGGVLEGLFRHCLSIPLEQKRRFSLYNSALNKISIENGQWNLELWGSLEHLETQEALDDN